jgi:hypothetical protein
MNAAHALLLVHLHESELRREADAHRLASTPSDATRHTGPGRLGRLQRALRAAASRNGGRSLDLPAAT